MFVWSLILYRYSCLFNKSIKKQTYKTVDVTVIIIIWCLIYYK